MPKHKYNARRTVVDGISFASAKEARRYGELKLMERAGQISELKLQVRYKLVQTVTYVADFEYFDTKKKNAGDGGCEGDANATLQAEEEVDERTT